MDVIFGIYGVENPYSPIFMILGALGRAGEGGGTWGWIQGPGKEGGAGAEQRA